ncbi:MAG: 4'-phosphopantetheinyl transferase superfamily protein [Acidobacteriota bacterium]|nr:4'-phosphopantetheinyl transferase superfamily protein [Acidobacteriota bacterium]
MAATWTLSLNTVVFNYGPKGKPSLAGDPIHFNVSHSENRALFAFCTTTALSVDVEAVRPLPDMLQVARSTFSISELKALEALAPEIQYQAFFRCWTRKEAFVKALGDGLSYPLERFSVSLDEPAHLIHVDGEPAASSQWTLQYLTPHDGFVGAIATRLQHPRIFVNRWEKVTPGIKRSDFSCRCAIDFGSSSFRCRLLRDNRSGDATQGRPGTRKIIRSYLPTCSARRTWSQ